MMETDVVDVSLFDNKGAFYLKLIYLQLSY